MGILQPSLMAPIYCHGWQTTRNIEISTFNTENMLPENIASVSINVLVIRAVVWASVGVVRACSSQHKNRLIV